MAPDDDDDEGSWEDEDTEDAGEDDGPPEPTMGSWPEFLAGATDSQICDRFAEESYALFREEHSALADSLACLALIDEHGGIQQYELTNVYAALRRRNPDKDTDVLMILVSPGGEVEPAYQIAKLCRDFAPTRFVVAVPRRAKSAATLLALGADEVHIGPLGHLGPIDPQLDGLPALAVSQALETIATMTQRHPEASDMFARYLRMTLTIEQIGYSERVSESAVHYAERLLSQHEDLPKPAAEIARHLVHDYKDHSFVIDVWEAQQILGESWVHAESDELTFADDFYALFEYVSFLLARLRTQRLVLAGEVGERPLVTKLETE